jgi:hypothetical protein
MKSQWQFRVVFKQRVFIAQHNGSPRIIEGTDTEALAFADRIQAYFNHYDLERVEARSVGTVDLAIPNAPKERVVFKLHRRGDVWQFEPHRNVASAKDTNLDWLINLAVIRSRGYPREIQIFNETGVLQEVVLVNSNGDPLD